MSFKFKSRKTQTPIAHPAVASAQAAVSACEFWIERGDKHYQNVVNQTK